MEHLDKLLHAKAIAIGKLALRATTSATTGHPTTALLLRHHNQCGAAARLTS